MGVSVKERSKLVYATIILAAIQCIAPFLKWVKIPALNNLASLFGGSGDEGNQSLIELFQSIQSMLEEQLWEGTYGIVMIVACLIGAAIAANIVFIIAALADKGWCHSSGFLGSIFMLAGVGVMYAVIRNEMGNLGDWAGSLINSTVEITFVPYLVLACAAANMILFIHSFRS